MGDAVETLQNAQVMTMLNAPFMSKKILKSPGRAE